MTLSLANLSMNARHLGLYGIRDFAHGTKSLFGFVKIFMMTVCYHLCILFMLLMVYDMKVKRLCHRHDPNLSLQLLYHLAASGTLHAIPTSYLNTLYSREPKDIVMLAPRTHSWVVRPTMAFWAIALLGST